MSKNAIISNDKIVGFIECDISTYLPHGKLVELPELGRDLIDSSYIFSDGKFAPPSIEYLRSQLKHRVSDHKKTMNGIKLVQVDGHYLDVSYETHQLVVSIFSALKDGLVESINFKFLDGFGVYDKTTFKAVAATIVSEIQRLFEVECKHYMEIDSITDIDTLYQYDIYKYW